MKIISDWRYDYLPKWDYENTYNDFIYNKFTYNNNASSKTIKLASLFFIFLLLKVESFISIISY